MALIVGLVSLFSLSLTIINPNNKSFVTESLKILSTYIKEGITVEYDDNFPINLMRIYINGTPEFFNDGTIKVK